MSEAATYAETTDGRVDYQQGQSVADLELFVALASDPKGLSTSRFYRADYLCRALFRRMEHDYYQYKPGTFEAQTKRALRGISDPRWSLIASETTSQMASGLPPRSITC